MKVYGLYLVHHKLQTNKQNTAQGFDHKNYIRKEAFKIWGKDASHIKRI